MAIIGKASLKRSKPNYIYSIVGVALVLLIMGIMGWFFLNISSVGNAFKEDIRLSAYLRTLNKDTIGQIQQFIAGKPYARSVTYIDKNSAKQIWNKENNEDWATILDINPLPESIDFYAKANYVNGDSLTKISNDLMAVYGDQITELQYPKILVSNLNERASKIGLIFLVVAIILSLIVTFSIDNTIRLTMFSNRFLIKTMQMVGATRGFISKPLNIQALINGLISSGIAIVLLFTLISWAESQFEPLKAIRDFTLTLILFGGLIILGVGISVYSTHRSVLKYLKMKLDELY
ncbi:MAG: permease-like cell division protein FtsX [Chitinophagaceae bacterium]|nr:permease-like cell division protein FtsX [Chitinophagaceae bacterium]MDP1764303.1 permease-like cell division protein FtsX [Sediminibacterium sp.]MDP1812567.1 permease-like cell division protein FtsX [Sediminibacterium sp.]MDP3128324.1 permease-like cell division protein FtsX [Sediminibacterium sp.]MDP3666771.1 permease-like cell division protein FtsX [Sediminibacterium sp.]